MLCGVPDCENESTRSGGLCNTHYIRLRRHGDTKVVLIQRYLPGQTCMIDTCEQPVFSKSYCRPHYERHAKYGDAAAGPALRVTGWPARFWAKVNKTEGCWEWTGSLTKPIKGYGQVRFNGKTPVAHRISYELCVGPVPDGMDLDHLCRNRRCVRPDHLEPVPPDQNFMRGQSPLAAQRRQTHCKRGHPLSGANLQITSQGSRRCRECRRQRQRKT